MTANGTIEMLPFGNAVFDAVISSLVLQWLPDPEAAMQELRRVARPGGLIAVSSFGANTLRELRLSFAEYDDYPHVSPFIVPDGSWEREVMTEYFPDLLSLMHALKIIGAGNKLDARRKAVMPPGALKKIEAFYRRHFGSDGRGLPVTWEVLYKVETAS
jgi:malonyl-CoA O-methyltransferase